MGIKNKIDYAFRALKANRLCSSISILGLGLGLVCFIVILKYVWQEYTTDTFQRNYHRIFCTVSQASELDIPCLSDVINFGERIADFPEVEGHTAVSAFVGEKLLIGEQVCNADILFTRSGFFDVFEFPLLVGDTATALQQTTDMIVTESFAQKIFGQQDPLGKEIQYWNNTYKITGILKDIPVNSSFHFDVLILNRPEFSRMMSEFLVLKENCNIQAVKERLKPEKFYGGQHFNYDFIPFEELYFNTQVTSSVFRLIQHGNKQSLGILLITGLVILLISLVNYLNIYQVALLRRDKELGVKRVLGERNWNLWQGFWIENLIMAVCAVVFAIVTVSVVAGWIENEMGLPVRLNLKFDLLLLMSILLVIPGVASCFSLWKYRKLQPAMAMKSSGVTKQRTFARHVLLGIQYVMTMVMLIVSFYFIRQLDFMLNKDLGINQKNIVHAMLFESPKLERLGIRDKLEREKVWEKEQVILRKQEEKVNFVIQEIQKSPYIQNACAGMSLLDRHYAPWRNVKMSMDFISCQLMDVTPEYLPLYGLKVKEGRFFEEGKDEGREQKLVVNETARRILGINSLDEVELESESWGKGWKVIGVVEDFRVAHLAVPVAPMVMIFFGDREDCPYQMHITEGKEKEVLALLQELYKKMEVPGELEYHFWESEVQALYVKDKKIAFIATLFTLIAIFISSIGLFGFAFFDTRQRYREIGIRKVNGATPVEILILLFRRFIVLISVAFVISLPVAWGIIGKYRENFMESVSVPWWLFVYALVLTGGVAFLTLLWQSRKAALANPADSLKTE